MDLAFGTNVVEHGYPIGRLAGIEVDRRTRIVRNIVIAAPGNGASGERRPLVAVPADHFGGDIVLRGFLAGSGETVAPDQILILTDATRVMRGGRQIGRLSGVELSPETGAILAVTGSRHWWARRLHLPISELDFSAAGEIRVGASASRAA